MQIELSSEAKSHLQYWRKAGDKAVLNKISKLKITISAKANNEGNLFGGISADQLSKILQEKHGIQIDASKIELKQNIKTLGEHKVAIKLGQESETFLLVNVVEDTDKKK